MAGQGSGTRWRSGFLGLVLLGWAAVGAYEAAQWATPRIAQYFFQRVEAALARAGFGWAKVEAGVMLRESAPQT